MPNPVCFAVNLSSDDELRIIKQIIGFAWDDELIRVSRIGSHFFVIFTEPLDFDAQNRLSAILGRDVVPVQSCSVMDWRTIHQFDPENC